MVLSRRTKELNNKVIKTNDKLIDVLQKKKKILMWQINHRSEESKQTSIKSESALHRSCYKNIMKIDWFKMM